MHDRSGRNVPHSPPEPTNSGDEATKTLKFGMVKNGIGSHYTKCDNELENRDLPFTTKVTTGSGIQTTELLRDGGCLVQLTIVCQTPQITQELLSTTFEDDYLISAVV